jgi:hypothetical protein
LGTEREKAARRNPDYSPRVGIYARVSFAESRGWTVTEYVDHGVSGAKE